MRNDTTHAEWDATSAIFLSPHYDDAVLSCGGTVALLADQGCQPLVVTIFGGEVLDDMITDFAKWKHSRWGAASVEDIVYRRQEEDGDAVRVLGGIPRWLGYPDAIYRGDRYLSDPSLFGGKPQPIETGLVDMIANEIRAMPEWDEHGTVYVPMAIGGHVDHQLIYAVGRQYAAQGVRVLAYMDCPYAMHTPAGVERRLADVASEIGSPIHAPIASTLARRIAAIDAYRTQVPVIFRFTTDVPGTVTDFARQIGGDLGPAERFWPILGMTAATQVDSNVGEHARQMTA